MGARTRSRWPSRSARRELLRKRAPSSSTNRRKTGPSSPAPTPREFWQRAEDRNRGTAELYDTLGLAEYEAIEGFVRWKGNTDAVL